MAQPQNKQNRPKQPQDPYAQKSKQLASAVQRLRGWVGGDPSRTPELADALVALTEHRLLGHAYSVAAPEAQEAVKLAAQQLTANGPIGPYTSVSDAARYVTAIVHLGVIQTAAGLPEAGAETVRSVAELREQLGSLPLAEALAPTTVVWALACTARGALAGGDVAAANAYADAVLQRLAEAGLRTDPDAAYVVVDADRLVSDARWAADVADDALPHLHVARKTYDRLVDGRLAQPGRLSPALLQRLAEPLFGLYRDLADRLLAVGEVDLGLVTRRQLIDLLGGIGPKDEIARVQLAGSLGDLVRDLRGLDRVEEAELVAEELSARPAPERKAAGELSAGIPRGSGSVRWEPLDAVTAYAGATAGASVTAAVVEAELQREAADRLAAERSEAHRLEQRRLEEARRQAERRDAERAEEARRAAERAQAEQAEAARREYERIEAARVEAELLAAEEEADRRERQRRREERMEAHRLEAERLAAERIEAERAAMEQREAERRAMDPAELERIELERLQAEIAELERVEEESARAEAENAEAERAEAERADADRAEADRAEADRGEADRAGADRAEADRAGADRAEADRLEQERRERERRERARAEEEWLEGERRAREEVERAEAERARGAQIEADRVARERQEEAARAEAAWLEGERQAREQRAAEEASAARAAAERQEEERRTAEAEAARAQADSLEREGQHLESEHVHVQVQPAEPQTVQSAPAGDQPIEVVSMEPQHVVPAPSDAEPVPMAPLEDEPVEAAQPESEPEQPDSGREQPEAEPGHSQPEAEPEQPQPEAVTERAEPEPAPVGPGPEPEPADLVEDELTAAHRAWQEAKGRGDRKDARALNERVVDLLRPRAEQNLAEYGPRLLYALEELSSARLRSGDLWGSRAPAKEAKALAKGLGRR
ncbi:MAG TPA: hypothetical protein VIT65_07585 [Microlunatus sp.]